MGEAPGTASEAAPGAGTASTIVLALVSNLVIAAAKAAGALISGSPALLSEAAHSVADSMNEVFLLTSLRRGRRVPDRKHPFGYGKERYFWSLLAAVGIFITGGCFSFYQAAKAWRQTSGESHSGYIIGLSVLAVALLTEGGSLAKAVLQLRAEARQQGRSTAAQLRRGTDPALRTVLAEDSSAVLGVLLAGAGMALHMATGNPRFEAASALCIGILLVVVAVRLGREAEHELIGQAVDPEVQGELRDFLLQQPEIDTVPELLTMRMGPASTLLAARVDLNGGIDSERLEDVCVRIKRAITARWPAFDQVFLDITDAEAQAHPRTDRARTGQQAQ
nr:cation diffusion facilitator family transporter [Streptacidiphilus sp. PB12-B1b]